LAPMEVCLGRSFTPVKFFSLALGQTSETRYLFCWIS
jgi:hypothetical protein